MIIKIQNLTKLIKKQIILNNISMELNSGKIIGLKGINGSGKTMLMRSIAGLIYPTKGKILVDGKELGKDISFPPSMGLLIENPAFLDEYSGLDNLRLLADINGIICEQQISTVLDMIGLNPVDRKKYKKYSLGMKQRLGIAAAFMENPKLILLDEPTNALDEDGIQKFKYLLAHYRNEDTLIIIACHDFHLLSEISDEIYVLQNGSIINHTVIPEP